MSTIIRFEDPESFEQHSEAVTTILEENGLLQGDYLMTRSFPPIIMIPKSLDELALDRLKELKGLIVDVPDDDE